MLKRLLTVLVLPGVVGTFIAASSLTTSNVTGGTAAPVTPAYREVTIPAGTILPLTLDSAVGSDRSRVEDPVRAHIRRAIVIDGMEVLPAGTRVIGSVTSLKRAGKVKGRAYLALRFHSLKLGADTYHVTTSRVARQAPGTKKQDAAKIAIPAAGGAIIGGLAGGKKGAAIGTAVGGGGGTAYVLSTRGKEIRLGPGAAIGVRLLEPITVRVPTSQS